MAEMENAPLLLLHGIGKDYSVDGHPFRALDEISVSFPRRGFVSILGPSGCGKTTLLNIIGGLDRASRGELVIDGKSTASYRDADWDAYRNARLGFVFQSYNLIERESALANVELPLLLAGVSSSKRKKMALKALSRVGLDGISSKKPNQLSGGQMQRVAIARAIVGSPSIVLADEPTGALDSASSKTVAEILKEISKDRLVILVTHNRELALRYSDRVIEMADGRIVSDSSPLPVDEGGTEGKRPEKTSMSFLSAIKNAVMSAFAKKGRTFLTAIASSVGIAGVALVLSISSGFSSYVSTVETSMASAVPITISKRTMAYASSSAGSSSGEEYPDEDVVYAYETTGQSYVVRTNDLSREYVEYVEALVSDPELKSRNLASDVIVERENLSFNIITSSTLDESDPNASFFLLDQGASASQSSLTSMVTSASSLPTSIFHPLYGIGSEEDPSDQYDLIYGRFPKDPTDLVLIVDRKNQVNISTLKGLGIVDDSASGGTAVSFADIVEKKKYKAYLQKDFYDSEHTLSYVDEAYSNVRIVSDGNGGFDAVSDGLEPKEVTAYLAPGTDSDSYRDFYFDESHNPIELRIVGIIRPSRNSFISTMPCSIGYLPSLDALFQGESNDETRAMAEKQTTNWYIPKTNYQKEDGLAALNELLDDLQPVLQGNSLDLSSLSELAASISDLLCYRSFFAPLSYIETKYAPDRLTMYGMLAYSRKVGGHFKEEKAKKVVDGLLGNDSTGLYLFLSSLFDGSFFSATSEVANAMDLIAYAEAYSLVSDILVFPSSMTTKGDLKAYLDAYNEGRPEAQRVTYVDAMSDFTESLGELVSVLAVVLILFASISLFVSSIMMAVITYVSVLERTKEIGILRACGARKRDVGRLFEAECMLVGALAGIIGVALSYILTIPLNLIISSLFSSYIALGNLASLPLWIGLILVVCSIALSFISGFVPARIAACRNPVEALRSE